MQLYSIVTRKLLSLSVIKLCALSSASLPSKTIKFVSLLAPIAAPFNGIPNTGLIPSIDQFSNVKALKSHLLLESHE